VKAKVTVVKSKPEKKIVVVEEVQESSNTSEVKEETK